jgi:cell division protease FtsH
VQKFIQNGYDWALKIIQKDDKEFERLAQGLLEYETLTGEEIERVMRGEPPQSPDDQDGDSAVKGDKPSLTSVPKAKKKNGSTDGSGLEPEPSA